MSLLPNSPKMDELEFLTESLGLKPSRKGAPMAASKAHHNANTSKFQNSRFTSDLYSVLKSLHGPTPTPSSSLSGVDDADMLFDSWNKSFSEGIDDFFRSFESNSEQKATIVGFSDDDFKGGGAAAGDSAEDWAYCEELIPGFAGSSRPNSPESQEEANFIPLQSTSHRHKTDESIFNSESSPLLSEQIAELNSSSKASSEFGSSQAKVEEGSMEEIKEFVDAGINRWASGKQGNVRALLSTLHYVVGAACGWKPVLMADLLASSSVKKFYKMAMLCVHPDKVQQRGANFQDMYTAQKVFHILKEAQNKFIREELA